MTILIGPIYDQMVGYIDRMHGTRTQRVSVRCGLADAAAICDHIATLIERQGRPSKLRRERAAVARACGDAIMEMYHKIRVGETP